MKKTFLAYGSWKYRHDENTSDEEGLIYLFELDKKSLHNQHSIFMDCRLNLKYNTIITKNGIKILDKNKKLNIVNLGETMIPLSILVQNNDDWVVTHFVTRIECDITHFIKSPSLPAKLDNRKLCLSIQELFSKDHLYLNNFECYYVKCMPDTELEQKYNIKTEYNYLDINRKFYQKLDDGKISGFRPQLGDEIEFWSYDNNFFEIGPNEDGVVGYVSNMFWSRKKKIAWNEPVSTYKKKLYAEDSLERWERNYHNVYISESPIDSLSKFFKLPLIPLNNFRRTRLDIACEAIETGNIFMVNFEDSRIENTTDNRGRITQCEIEYLKTRDIGPNIDSVYKDLTKISIQLENFMKENKLEFEKTNYSKLTFLKDYNQNNQV